MTMRPWFINDLPNFSDTLSTFMFADDANLTRVDDNLERLFHIANQELDKFYFWCINNRLSINTLKTFFVLFANKPPKLVPPLVIRSHSTYVPIKRVSNTKFLGIFYDERLCFKPHLDFIANKLSRISAMIYRLKDLMPIDVLRTLYQAHVYSILSYCTIIWANTYSTHIEPVIKLLKRMVRNITHSDFLAHSEPLFKQLKLLNFDSIRKYALAQYMYKNRHTVLPPLLPTHQYMTRNRDRIRLPERNTVLFEKSFLYQGPNLWNELVDDCPPEIIDSPAIHLFRRKLKTYLLSKQ